MTARDMVDLAARVDRGAEWLDRVYDQWHLRVDLGVLDLASSCRCVLGQLFDDGGEWSGYMNVLHIGYRADGDADPADWTVAHGFESEHGHAWEWDTLDTLWAAAITRRVDGDRLQHEVDRADAHMTTEGP